MGVAFQSKEVVVEQNKAFEKKKYLLIIGGWTGPCLKDIASKLKLDAIFFQRDAYWALPSLALFKLMRKNPIDFDKIFCFDRKNALARGRENRYKGLHRLYKTIKAYGFLSRLYRCYTKNRFDVLCLWNGRSAFVYELAVYLSNILGVKVLFFELGCLPKTIVIDTKGTNEASELPRKPAFYESYHKTAVWPKKIQARPASQCAAKPKGKPIILPKSYIFVPFQVFNDSQILLYSHWVHTMHDLYDLLANHIDVLPEDMYFVIKEHPSCKKSYSELYNKQEKIIFANHNETHELIDKAQAVITINSSVGIESLVLNKKVLMLGKALYNIEGIVQSANNADEFKQALTALPTWEPNRPLIKQFINYLINEYLIPANLALPGRPNYYLAVAKRLETIFS